jgi:PHP family Zn ribbon phosphoesterase
VPERKFRLIAKCRKCGYVITKEVETDLEDLPAAKTQFAKEVGSIHKQHPELDNFGIIDKMM